MRKNGRYKISIQIGPNSIEVMTSEKLYISQRHINIFIIGNSYECVSWIQQHNFTLTEKTLSSRRDQAREQTRLKITRLDLATRDTAPWPGRVNVPRAKSRLPDTDRSIYSHYIDGWRRKTGSQANEEANDYMRPSDWNSLVRREVAIHDARQQFRLTKPL